MRKISAARRRVVSLAASLACMGGVGPSLFHNHPRAEWMWLAAYIPVMIWVIVLMVRLRRVEGCA